MKKCINNLSVNAYVRVSNLIERNQTLLLFSAGAALILHYTQDTSIAQALGNVGTAPTTGITSGYRGFKYGEVCQRVLAMHTDDGYGSMLAAMAGVGAIIAAAMGSFKTTWALLVAAIGSFILNAYRTLFFGNSCGGPF